MTCGSFSSPAMTSAGSPGSKCCSRKMINDTKNSVGTSCRSLLPKKVSMEARASPSPELQADHPYQTVGQLPVAFQPCGMRNQHKAVIEIELGNIFENDLGELFVHGLALRHIGERASLVEQLVGLRIAITGVILRRLAFMEDVEIAVGIRAAAPGQEKSLILPG